MSTSPVRKIQTSFSSALLLARHEDRSVVDRQSLRRAGIRTIRMLTSGVEAARILAGEQRLADNLPFPDLVLCDEQLSDMSGQEFLALVRHHPKLASFPVIVALKRETPGIRREMEELACSGLLLRPYSGDAFLNQLARAAAMHPPTGGVPGRPASGSGTGAFDSALARFALSRKVSDQSAGQWFREGLICLKREQWEGAAVAFRQALKDQADHGDAIRGLTLALRKRQEEADANPHRRRRLSPEEADALRENLVRAAASGNPEEAIREVMIAALGEDLPPAPGRMDPGRTDPGRPDSGRSEAIVPRPDPSVPSDPSRAGLRLEMRASASETAAPPATTGSLALKPLPELHEPNASGVLSRFPLLRDAVNVARVTLGLYKRNKK